MWIIERTITDEHRFIAGFATFGGQGIITMTASRLHAKRFQTAKAAEAWAKRKAGCGYGLPIGGYRIVPAER